MVINGKRWKYLFKREMCCQNLMLQNIKGFQVRDDSNEERIEKKKKEVIQYYIMKFNLLYYEVIRSYLILYYQVALYVCFILFSNL